MNAQEAYYWQEREIAEEAGINKKFLFPLAYRMLQGALVAKTSNTDVIYLSLDIESDGREL